jgi:hypothetical protein
VQELKNGKKGTATFFPIAVREKGRCPLLEVLSLIFKAS